MNKLTKSQLANENQILRADLSRALIDIEVLKEQIEEMNVQPSAECLARQAAKELEMSQRGSTTYIMPSWQIDRLAAMTMARDMAVRTHSTIKVQS